MQRRLVSALSVVLFSATVLASPCVGTGIASAHKASRQIPATYCGSDGYWKTMYDTGWRGNPPYYVSFRVTLEAWTDRQIGNYCGWIRSKNTVYCNWGPVCWPNQQIYFETFLSWIDAQGNAHLISNSDNAVFTTLNLAQEYALFGFEIYSPNYPCPFVAKGFVQDMNGKIWEADTPAHCTL
jgi:hypothetical protein